MNLVEEAVYGAKTFPLAGTTGPLYQNSGAASDFYLKVRAQWYPIWDFQVTPASPRLTVDPSTPTRGDTVTFTVVDAPGGTLSNWHYDITDGGALSTVTRTVDTGAVTWAGQLVVSGTAKVTVGLGAFTGQLEKHVDVTPRTWSAFPPKTPDKRPMDYVSTSECGTKTMHYAAPGTGGTLFQGISMTVFCPWASVNPSEYAAVDGAGPNTGVWWLLDVHDATVIDWGRHIDIENPDSDFWKANCGTFEAGPGNACGNTVGTGFMRAETFRDQVQRHEIGDTNSHYAIYLTEMSKPDNSFRPKLEPIVAPPESDLVAFRQKVRFAVLRMNAQIMNAVNALTQEPPPCSALCDETCSTSIGTPNLLQNGSYAACPVPTPLVIQFFTPKGRVR